MKSLAALIIAAAFAVPATANAATPPADFAKQTAAVLKEQITPLGRDLGQETAARDAADQQIATLGGNPTAIIRRTFLQVERTMFDNAVKSDASAFGTLSTAWANTANFAITFKPSTKPHADTLDGTIQDLLTAIPARTAQLQVVDLQLNALRPEGADAFSPIISLQTQHDALVAANLRDSQLLLSLVRSR